MCTDGIFRALSHERHTAPAAAAGLHAAKTVSRGEGSGSVSIRHYMHYNFARPHSSLDKMTTPAMAAGAADHVWALREIAALLD